MQRFCTSVRSPAGEPDNYNSGSNIFFPMASLIQQKWMIYGMLHTRLLKLVHMSTKTTPLSNDIKYEVDGAKSSTKKTLQTVPLAFFLSTIPSFLSK